MANGYTLRELQFMEDQAQAIDAGAGNLQDLISAARTELNEVEWKKMAILLTYLYYGKEGFRLNIWEKGPSKSVERAEMGQIRFGIWLEIDTKKTGLVKDFVMLEMKGTLQPTKLKELLQEPLLKSLYPILGEPFSKISKEIVEYVMSTTNFPA